MTFWARVLLAAIVGLFIVLAIAPFFIPLLRRLKFGQEVRDDGPRTHLKKQGTATMGGVMIILAAGISGFVFAIDLWKMLLLFLTMLGCGVLGLWDDFLIVVLRRPLGLRARAKVFGQVLVGVFLAWSVYLLDMGTTIDIPFLALDIEAGFLYYVFVVVILISATNAVNLTDGLDGLASGLMVVSCAAYVLIAWKTGDQTAAIFAAAVGGSCLGFLRYNYHPAKIFMGDTGSLALGGVLAALAVITGTELILFLLGGVFVLEVLSVIIQVVSFKLTGKRIFKMSPLHHHFELLGWSEVKVVHIFWLIGICFAALSLFAI